MVSGPSWLGTKTTSIFPYPSSLTVNGTALCESKEREMISFFFRPNRYDLLSALPLIAQDLFPSLPPSVLVDTRIEVEFEVALRVIRNVVFHAHDRDVHGVCLVHIAVKCAEVNLRDVL